jgi:hypothetical protein
MNPEALLMEIFEGYIHLYSQPKKRYLAFAQMFGAITKASEQGVVDQLRSTLLLMAVRDFNKEYNAKWLPWAKARVITKHLLNFRAELKRIQQDNETD